MPVKKELDDPAYTGHFMALHVIPSALKAPSTATFCSRRDCEVEEFSAVRDAAGNTHRRWNVVGWVDSQNSFGAMIRTKWNVAFYLVGDRYEFGAAALDGKMILCDPVYEEMVTRHTARRR